MCTLLRVVFLFPPSLWSSYTQVLLGFKAKCCGVLLSMPDSQTVLEGYFYVEASLCSLCGFNFFFFFGLQGLFLGFPGGSDGKESDCNAGGTRDMGLIPRWGRTPEEGNGNLFQYSCLESPMDREAWVAIVH